MAADNDPSHLRVGCECGQWLPVEPTQAGSAVVCSSCRLRVEVPLLDEFREQPDLLSAPTLERRVRRLVARGELPPLGGCARCAAGAADVTPINVVCERYTSRSGGGERFILIPFFSLFVWAWWYEEEWVEIYGRDTDVPAPLCLCGPCREHFRGRSGRVYLAAAITGVVAGWLVGYASVAAGVGVGVAGVLGAVVWRRLSRRARRRELLGLLCRVPAYRQVLADYPDAVAVLPSESAIKPNE